MIAFSHVWLLPIALILDGVCGDPDFIWSRLPHPVVGIGRAIGWLDHLLNRPRRTRGWRRAAGAVAILVAIGTAAAIGYVLEALCAALPFGWIATAVLAAILLAGRSLYDHVAAVGGALDAGGIAPARVAVARIVGRDTQSLDAAGVVRAALESLAESFCDGVIAPALWFALLGLPGIAAYKAINTADSMIGHLSERHADFGWAAARLDDLVNLPASRLAGVLIALAAPVAGGKTAAALRTMIGDAGAHRSPNAGWPEAAMAGALGLALGGPRSYGGDVVEEARLNASGRHDATVDDLRRGLNVYLGATGIFTGAVALAGLTVLLA